MIGWLLLIIASPFTVGIDKFLISIVITLFCIVYAWLIVSSFTPADIKNFGSLDGVMGLFQNKTLVTAGWVHYLAFDLMTGVWIKKNSVKYGISHWIIIPCLLFTFMLGPIGLLLYLLIRLLRRNNILLKIFNAVFMNFPRQLKKRNSLMVWTLGWLLYYLSVCGLLILASVLGYISGYWFGRKTGLLLYSRGRFKIFSEVSPYNGGSLLYQVAHLILKWPA